MIIRLLFICWLFSSSSSFAKGIYQQPDEFIQNAFHGPVKAKVIWIEGELRNQIEDILQHKYKAKRLRYWQLNNRSVWILNEVGKKKAITVGIIIEDNKISQLKVLIFRESRGWEVRYPFFSKQFNQLSLKSNNQLSTPIDGISGATLSVRALRKMATIALLLNKTITKTNTEHD